MSQSILTVPKLKLLTLSMLLLLQTINCTRSAFGRNKDSTLSEKTLQTNKAKMEEFKNKYVIQVPSEAKDKIALSELSLPAWLNYDHYKTKFDKNYQSDSENQVRHHLFVDNCLNILKQRAEYRAERATYFTAINKFADYTPEELSRMTGLRSSSSPNKEVTKTDLTAAPAGDPYAKAVEKIQEMLKTAEPEILTGLIAELQSDEQVAP